jgi:hypothetical protein
MSRRQRIAMSLFFAMFALALVGVWVRSYRQWDDIGLFNSNSTGTCLSSSHGQLRLGPAINPLPVSGLIWQASPAEKYAHAPEFYGSLNHRAVACPHWFAVMIGCIGVAAPWCRLLFSLRTMFVTTTVAASLLGLGVWLASS